VISHGGERAKPQREWRQKVWKVGCLYGKLYEVIYFLSYRWLKIIKILW